MTAKLSRFRPGQPWLGADPDSLPHGGPIKLDRRIAQVFVQQVALYCHPIGSFGRADAELRRDRMLARLPKGQRSLAKALATDLAGACFRKA